MPPLDDLDAIMQLGPDALAAFAMSIDENQVEQDREFYEGSLLRFFARAWREIDPDPFMMNWHHVAIAKELETLSYGENRDLIVNQPPRTGKSNLISICWPAWSWIQDPSIGHRLMGPHVRFLCVSYSAKMADVLALKMLRLVSGPWYQRLWGHRVKLRHDQAARNDFGNWAGGERISASIEGGILGRGGDVQILDDPHSLEGAESDLQREGTIRAISEGLTTRVTDPRILARVLVMQRLNSDDATNYALTKWRRDLRHVMIPMRFDLTRPCYCDERSLDGELLWPARWGEGEVRALESEMNSYAIAGQFQQSPIPRGGGIIDRDWWQAWPDYAVDMEKDLRLSADRKIYNPLNPEVSYVLVVLDTAISLSEQADWNACTVWGIWHGPEPYEQPRAILMTGWRRRCRLHDDTIGPDGWPLGLVERTLHTARIFKADAVLIEDKTRGRDVRDELIREMTFSSEFMLHLFDPRKHGDKINRLLSTQPLFTAKMVYAPVGFDAKTGEVVEYRWCQAVITEVSAFPKTQFDDFTDTVSMGLLWLRGQGLLPLPHEHQQQQIESRLLQTRRNESPAQRYGVG